jgi:hypothetical protein
VEAGVEEAHNKRKRWTKKVDLGPLVLKLDGVSGFKRSGTQAARKAAEYHVAILKRQRAA